MSKLTPKQEAFALLVAEGKSYSAAYRQAYDAENMSNEVIWKEASILMAVRKVAVRVMELQEMAQERTLVTVEGLTKDLIEIRERAKVAGDITNERNSTMDVAKLNGLLKDKLEHSGGIDISGFSVEFHKPSAPTD